MTERFPKVSVMVVTYNQEDLISDTIESVLAQDYPNFEIVISDDASTDGTANVIRDYEIRFPGIVRGVYNKINLGITGNSNTAFFACEGELVALLGGDDLFLPGKLSAQVALFEDPEVTISYHGVDVFVHQTGEVLFTTNTTEKEQVRDVYDLIAKGGIPGASSIMVRRSACPAHGFHPDFPVVTDWIFSIEVALKGKVQELHGVYGKYRKHGLGASERTFELLDESLKTLSVVSAAHPTNKKLQDTCMKGGYRYLLGELYRQVVKGNAEKIVALKKYFRNYSVGFKRILTLTVLDLLSQKWVLSFVSTSLPKIKNLLKRNI
ncbi:glycosyltransferase [Pseudomonas sp. GL93]|uniref:glycosyltransferase family 2 protein n=1 Tax=Pseudomonas sp. GL93 TaxID=2014741 RepID=UPI0010583D32|nr:glycosyltransferase [Pseudomonas sp. GL93]